MEAYDLDAILRGLGGDYEVMGTLLGREITRKEAREHPEILQDVRFLPECKRREWTTIPLQTEDWKCKYCGNLRPSKEYECGYCGAPRQSKEDIQSGVNEELKKLWIKEVFKTWRKQVLE